MCPVAAESKNSKPSSKKKINKKINTNLETVVEEDINNNGQSLEGSSQLNQQIFVNFDYLYCYLPQLLSLNWN